MAWESIGKAEEHRAFHSFQSYIVPCSKSL
jgi:hypothetical protein